MNSTDRSDDIFKYVLYSVQGFVLVALNLSIVVCVLRHKSLRDNKSYLIVCGLAFADVLNGCGYMSAGPYRIGLINAGQDYTPVNTWDCMCTVHNIFWIVGTPLAALMLICVSLDRLVAIAAPTYYYVAESSYAYGLVGAFYVPVFAMALVGIGVSYTRPREPKYTAICFTDYAVGHELYLSYYWMTDAVGALGSVILYVLVYVIYVKKKSNNINELNTDAQQLEQRKVQHRLLITVGLSSSASFVFAVLPALVRTALVWTGASGSTSQQLYRVVGPYSSIVTNMNPMCNLALYAWRHDDLRKGLRELVTCHQSNQVAPHLSVHTQAKDNMPQVG